MKVKLGKQYRDRVSGFEGIATARYEFLNKCVRIELTGRSEENKKPPAIVFDIDQLEKAGEGITTDAKPSGGGSMDELAPRNEPTS